MTTCCVVRAIHLEVVPDMTTCCVVRAIHLEIVPDMTTFCVARAIHLEVVPDMTTCCVVRAIHLEVVPDMTTFCVARAIHLEVVPDMTTCCVVLAIHLEVVPDMTTCCVVRANHLEIVPDMTTQSFIGCFKRFTAPRGVPIRIISDNGRTFKSAAKLLVKILKQPKAQECFAGIHIEWSFNLEKASWWGGIFECMIKSVKRCLWKTIGRGKLT